MRIERPIRPNWPERKWPRVAFIAHALLDGYRSTDLISRRLDELGQKWPQDGEDPGFINWFSFPVTPVDGQGQSVWVDFYIIPVLAGQFLAACKSGQAYDWAEAVALAAIAEAKADGVHITVGWGALTKVATTHGARFLERNAWVKSDDMVSTTHGDAGTAALVLETIRRAGFKRGFRVAVIGANGAIGDAISRLLPSLSPESILLVGKGGEVNASRLNELRARVFGGGDRVAIHQDKSSACHDHRSDLVIIATTGMDIAPSEIPLGALVLDMTTPSACHANSEWQNNRLVLASGCGRFADRAVKESFGQFGGELLADVGAGGHHVLWGCAGETITRAVAEWHGHVAGTNIPLGDIQWCDSHFPELGFAPQLPVSFGRSLDWSDVHAFVERSQKRISVQASQHLHQ